MNLKDYYVRLKDHDWFYYMSDDSKVRNVGAKEELFLIGLAQKDKEFNDLYEAFLSRRFATLRGVEVPLPLPKEPK